MSTANPRVPGISLEDNLKKALTELLLLRLLCRREYYIGELTATLNEESGGVLSIVFPYSAVYRLQKAGLIAESDKRTAPDGRRRQYYGITDEGRAHCQMLLEIYRRFSTGIDTVLAFE
jgi:PadR family transcriptional regulator PadR